MIDDIPEVARSIETLRKFMDDFTKALDALVEGVSATAPNEVRACLPVYAQIVPAFDERLVQCADLLHRGLRDEAVGYEADTPALIEAVTLLDLASRPHWEAWKTALASREFPLPTLPRMDLAGVLVEARNTLVDLKPLLDRWRRLNLSNAPLPERLVMLRKLRQKDPNNEVWFTSIIEHEKQRLMEIERDIKAAIAAKDEASLNAIIAELAESWAEPPPGRLKTAAVSALEGFKSSRLDRQMDEVGRDLAAAFEARDLDAGRQLRRQWAAVLEEKGLAADADPRVTAAEPATAWVDRHDRFEALLMEIPQALDAEPSGFKARRQWVRTLERMGQETEDLAEKLHDEVDLEPIERNLERISRIVESFAREEKFRRRLMFAGVAAAALLIAGVVFESQRRSSHEQQVRAAIAAIEGSEKRIQAGEEEDPDAVVEKYPPAVKSDPRVSGRLVTARAEKQRQDARRKRLADALDLVDAGMRAVEAARQARKDPLQPWPVEFAKATKDLAGAAGDAVTDAEKRLLQTRRNDIDIAKTKFHTDADTHVADAIREINARLVALRELVTKDREALIKGVGEQRERFRDLRRRAMSQAAPEADGEYEILKTASAKVRTLIAEDGGVAKQLDELTALAAKWEAFGKALALLDADIGNWAKYADQLRAIAGGFPDIAEARDYGASVGAAPMWGVVDAWSRIAGTVGAVRTAADAQELLKGIDGLGEAASRFQPVDDFKKRYGPVLEALAKQKPGDAKAKVEKFLDSEWLTEIKSVVIGDDDVTSYYCIDAPRPGDFFKYVVGWKGELVDGEWPLKQSGVAAAQVRPAPQLAMREGLRTAIRNVLPEGPQFDEVVVKLLETVIQSKQVDPVLRAVTLRQVFGAARNQCRALRCVEADALTRALEDPQNPGTITGIPKEALVLWVKPDRETRAEYVRAEAKAREVLDQAQDAIPAMLRAIATDKALLANLGGERLVLVGRMGRDDAGRGSAVVRGKVAAGELLTIDATGGVKPAGTIDASGRFAPVNPAAPAGSPLYRRERFGPATKPPTPAEKTPPLENRGT